MTAIILLALLTMLGRAADPVPVALSTPTYQDFIVDSGLKLAGGDFAKAKESASRAILLAPSNPKGYVQRASCELKLKAYPEAEVDATKAIDLKYQKASPFNMRSTARSRMGRYAEALADADQALKYSPGSAIGHMNRAAAEAGLKKPAAKPVAQKGSSFSLPALPALPWRLIAGGAAILVMLVLALGGRSERRFKQMRYGGLPTASPASGQVAPGSVVGGRYIVGAFTGRADDVEFYEARDLSDAPRVLKRLEARQPQAAGEALARAQRAAALKSSNVEAVEAFIQESGHLCLACMPLPGETLDRLMKRLPSKKLSADAALRMFQGVCEALEAGHKSGLPHGRLKPSSIWVERGIGRLADFGLVPGGPDAYRPPEDEAGVEADLFGLGVCLYEALTGAQPFEGDDAAMLKREGRFPPASSRGGPAGLDSVLARALAADPRNRFHSAAEFLAAFKDVVSPPVQ